MASISAAYAKMLKRSNRFFSQFKKPLRYLLGTPWLYVVIAAGAYTGRAWQYIARPQLYAEDGAVWLANGFNDKFISLIQPLNGFFHLPERLFGFTVALLPLQLAPWLFNLAALLIFIGLVYYLFSPRTQLFQNTYEKVFVLAGLCLIANVDEFFFNFSNSIFLIGIIGVLILIARPARNQVLGLLEKIFFSLSCFTLPFAWFYLPVLLIERYKFHKKQHFFLVSALAGGLLQLSYFLFSNVERSVVTFRALFSAETAVEVYNQIIIPAVRFARVDINLANAGLYGRAVACLVVFGAGLLTLNVFKNSNKQVRYLLFFLAAMTFAALKSPFIQTGEPLDAIRFMSTAEGGDRYFVFGILAFYLVLAKTALTSLKPLARQLFLVSLVSFGIITSLHYRSFKVEKHFADYTEAYRSGVTEYQASHQTKEVIIPVNPGHGWVLKLQPRNKQ